MSTYQQVNRSTFPAGKGTPIKRGEQTKRAFNAVLTLFKRRINVVLVK